MIEDEIFTQKQNSEIMPHISSGVSVVKAHLRGLNFFTFYIQINMMGDVINWSKNQ